MERARAPVAAPGCRRSRPGRMPAGNARFDPTGGWRSRRRGRRSRLPGRRSLDRDRLQNRSRAGAQPRTVSLSGRPLRSRDRARFRKTRPRSASPHLVST